MDEKSSWARYIESVALAESGDKGFAFEDKYHPIFGKFLIAAIPLLVLGTVLATARAYGIGGDVQGDFDPVLRVGLKSLAGAIVFGWGLEALLAFRRYWFLDSVNQSARELNTYKANLIVFKGGPKTLEEYLAVFPNACVDCGFRKYALGEHSGRDDGFGPYYTQCLRCGLCSSLAIDFAFDTPLNRHTLGGLPTYEAISPYLDDSTAKMIPEWADRMKSTVEKARVRFTYRLN